MELFQFFPDNLLWKAAVGLYKFLNRIVSALVPRVNRINMFMCEQNNN